MPYIPKKSRKVFKSEIDSLGKKICTPGELNYIISMLLYKYMDENGPVNYKLLNETLGVLEAAKLEFYRRVVSSYEDEKIKLEGDIG